MKNTLKGMAVVCLLLGTGCYSLKVTTRDAVPVTNVNGENERTKTFHLFLGTEKIWQEDLCDGAPLAEVIVEPNLIYSLANVITLGIWKPIRVTYKCNEGN